jgi:hypothetical protein
MVFIGLKHKYQKEEHRSSVSARKEICLEVNAERNEYKSMSRHQSAGQNHFQGS